MDNLSTSEIKQQTNISTLAQQYGLKLTKRGSEYMTCCPFHEDHNASLSINDEKGQYYCFGCMAKGDVFNFIQQIANVDFQQSLKIAKDNAGIIPIQKHETTKKKDTWKQIKEISNNAINQLPKEVYGRKVENYYKYYDLDNKFVGVTIRVPKEDGGKDVYPLTWCSNGKKEMWRFRGFGHYIYRGELLKQRRYAVVIIVEGEKCCDDLLGLLTDNSRVVVISCGPYTRVIKLNLDILNGRDIILWPDADTQKCPKTGEILPQNKQPGMKTMNYIANKISGSISVVMPAPDKKNGWDVSDGIRNEGWGIEDVASYLISQKTKKTYK